MAVPLHRANESGQSPAGNVQEGEDASPGGAGFLGEIKRM